MHRIIVTGGAGFIGSAVARHIINDTPDAVCVVDKLSQHIGHTVLTSKRLRSVKRRKIIGVIEIGLFGIGLVLRLIKIIIDPLLMRDSALYLVIAEKWNETKEYTEVVKELAIRPPLPLFTIKKMIDYGYSSEIAGRSISLFLGAILPVLGFSIALLLFKRIRIALYASLVLLLHPTLITYSIQPIRENYYLFFLGLLTIEAIKGINGFRYRNWILCGLFLALAFFCRYEALEIIPILLVLIIYLAFKNTIPIKKAIQCYFVLLLALVIMSCGLLSMTDFDASFIFRVYDYSLE